MAKIIKCKTCNAEIASSAKSCPSCGAKNKKPIYKRPWFIVIALFVIIGVIGGMGDDESDSVNSGTDTAGNEIAQNQNPAENDKEADVPAKEKIPTEYKTALRKAKTYSDTMHMSKAGLYDQLTSEYGEKYTAEAAKYAIDNVQANWKENALKKAKTYQESMAMSPSAIYDQLISEYGEKFTKEEAQYAIDNLQ
ncbi:Ltp family lipoprotein [Clostridium baratii]|uniref:Ltp family lipoprotein n=1 Tax=Clostridium baratii TaxID=1561 RepID=UPI0030D564EE